MEMHKHQQTAMEAYQRYRDGLDLTDLQCKVGARELQREALFLTRLGPEFKLAAVALMMTGQSLESCWEFRKREKKFKEVLDREQGKG